MKKILLFTAAALMLLACSKEDGAPEGKLQQSDSPKFYATTESAPVSDTKVYADENLRVLWNEGDKISIFNQRTYNDQYEFDGEDGDTGGGFELIPASGFYSANPLEYIYAVYPYSRDNKINNDGDQITVTLPAEQAYKEHSFGIGANTMVAATDNYFLAFKNICGYLRFRFYGDDISISSIKLEGNNGEKIAGKAFVTPVVGGTPTVAMDNTATGSITINCADPVTIGSTSSTATEFIFVVPPTAFSGGFKVTVTDAMGGVFQKSSTRSLEITRNKMESMGAMKVIPNYDDVFVEFDDENFEMFCYLNFGSGNDERVRVSDVIDIDTLDISGQGICSLKGIECFKSLVYLDCRNNQITSLDFSSNPKLEVARCYRNKLSSVNVTANAKLKILGLSAGNASDGHLTLIDVSNNPLLELLEVKYQPLTAIDVSQNPNLNWLTCDYTPVTSLDLSNHTSLEYIYAQNCSNLVSLNLTNTPNLSSLYLNASGLERVDVSDHTKLNCLWLSNSPNLTYLDCSGNQLTEKRDLVLTGCTALVELNCNNNQLKAIDVSDCSSLIYIFANNNKLTSVDLSNNTALIAVQVCDNELTALDISHNTLLENVQFWGNELTSWSGSAVNTALRNVSCQDNLLQSLDVSMLPALKTLYCSGNELSSLNLSGNSNLTYMTCDNNQLGSLDVSNNTLLDGLICHHNNLTALDLSHNPKMWQLDCSFNQLNALDLSTHQELWYVECCNNNITTLDVSKSSGITYVVAWPMNNNALTTLRKKAGVNITYMAHIGEAWPTINPADYGTTIVDVNE